jgi:hypothetical protein
MRKLRLEYLDWAIENNPDTAVNYVLRGELKLQQEDVSGALDDFEQAMVLAQVELEQTDWGYAQQAVIDRARHSIRIAKTLTI